MFLFLPVSKSRVTRFHRFQESLLRARFHATSPWVAMLNCSVRGSALCGLGTPEHNAMR